MSVVIEIPSKELKKEASVNMEVNLEALSIGVLDEAS